MAPGVPFAFMAGVQLLSVAAALGLAAAASFPRLRRRTTPVFVAGALLLALADGLTATQYGGPTSEGIAAVRVAGLLLMAAGLATGVLKPPGLAVRVPATTVGAGTVGAGAVVVPLGASVELTVAATVAALLAAAGSLRCRRNDRGGAVLLAVAFCFLAVSAGLTEAAGTSRTAAIALLAARLVATLLFFADLARLARSSVLAKVVTAMLAGVLAMALGAVAVGSVVASVVGRQQADQARQVAVSQLSGLETLVDRAGSFALVVAACPDNTDTCSRLLQVFGALPGSFAAVVERDGDVSELDEAPGAGLTRTAALQLRGQPVVQEVLTGSALSRSGQSTLAVLDGQLVAMGVAPIRAEGAGPNARPVAAAVYGGRVTNAYAAEQERTTTYAVSVLVGGRVAASSLPERQSAVVASEAQRAGVTSGRLAEEPVVVRRAAGRNPTAAFGQITARNGTPLGILAVSQDARVALAAERRAFIQLFVIALGVMTVVSVFALLLGRRIVDPVRRLTVVASRVRRGDLSATAGIGGSDEVGALSRAFDAMTASVSRLTGDLRTAAAQEASLRAHLETVLASMSDGLVATDPGRRVTSINPAAASLAGLDPEQAVGRPLTEVLDVRGADGEARLDMRRERLQGDGVLRRADGGTVPVSVAVAPLTGEDADAGGVVVVVRDQSRERELERMKTEFLSNVSHELRTPLTPIRGYAEILRRRPDLPRQQTVGYVDTILESSIRMSRVVDLLVDVAALEAGRVEPEPVTMPVDRYVAERLDAARARYPERAGDLRRRVARGLPKITADPRWLGKALDELVDNAVKHTSPGSSITLQAAPGPRGRVRVSVRDTGPGIEADAMPGLFSDFVQADGSATRQVGGLGLGLAFVRRLAETLGFEVFVESVPGRGCEFGIEVPAAAPRSRAGARGADKGRALVARPNGRTGQTGAARNRARASR